MDSSILAEIIGSQLDDGQNLSELDEESNLINMATQIVTAYVQRNDLPKDEIITLMDDVYAKLTEMSFAAQNLNSKPQAAVPIEESVTDDYIICLEDGKRFKMLKKHLMAAYGMTPEEYRAKWGLPANYPMVAPNYAMVRQKLARASGLGKKR